MTTTDLSLSRRLVISLVSVIVLLAAVVLLVGRPFEAEGLRLRAEFGRAGQGLGDNAPVKMRGVTVGRVAGIELTGTGRAVLTLEVGHGTKIPESVTASIEPASVFGPKFVNLLPGAAETTGPYLADGARIARTSDAQDLSDLLKDANQALAAIDPEEVSTIVHTLAAGLGGQGQRLRELIDNTATVLQVAHRQRHNARRFLGDGADLTTALRGSGPEIVSITADSNLLISQTAAGGTGRLGEFADGVAAVSGLVAHGFNKRGGQLREAFRSGERAVGVVYAQLGVVGKGIRTTNALLPVYQELDFPAPGGKNYLGVAALLPSNPCDLIVGLCGRSGGR